MFEEFEEYFDKALKGETVSIPLIDDPSSDTLSKLGTKIDVGKSMYLLFGGLPGCLSGDTIISIDRGTNQRSRKYKLKDLYRKFHRKGPFDVGEHKWNIDLATKITCYGDDIKRKTLIEVDDVVFSGVKKVFKLTLESGNTIKATKDHKFLTSLNGKENDYIKLENLSVGDNVCVEKHTKTKIKKTKKYRPEICGKYPYYKTARKRIVNGKEYQRIYKYRVVFDAGLNDLTVEEFLQKTKEPNNLIFSNKEMVVHHLDNNCLNNSLDNLKLLSKREHDKLHCGLSNYSHNIELSKIVSIVFIGEEETYDICCKDPYHNFIANGIVTHNSGKTAIVDTYFLLNLYLWWKRNKDITSINPYWIYRSMERAKFMKIAKWTCYLMYVDYGIFIDVPTILQRSNKSYDIKKKYHNGKSYVELIKGYKSFFNELEKRVTIIPGPENPTGIFNYAKNRMYHHGKHIYSSSKKIFINGKFQAEFGNETVNKNGDILKYKDLTILGNSLRVFQYENKFIEKDKNLLMSHISDHIGKCKSEKGLTSDKAIVDKHSHYMSVLRDVFYMTSIDIVQLNRNIEDTFRQVKTELDIQPKDFKGSANPYENADIVIGMFNPYKLGEMKYNNYEIQNMVNSRGYNRFRGLKVLKNSWGIDDFRIGYCFYGEMGKMKELPPGTEMTNEIYGKILESKF